ncbi:phosphoglycerate mutase [Lactobacillus sp.] [Lactiplantibacillus mudanjiangensis]|uniref:histidine phosphatase family protein n=1 Tax=Lactiplantibacillus mudanjiangensis TaxID=1296538 RepID=UPI0010144969|nr:phosphoglycerate mutase [Lactobacillus sp.] [Lactiplantibacillus mudanjiangensis]
MKAITLYLVVTGATYFDQLDRFQGWSGTPLTPDGLAASQAVGQQLSTVKFDTAFASDTSRGAQTGRAILSQQAVAPELQLKPALRAPFFGGFEGQEQAAVWSGFATKLGYPTVTAFEIDQTPAELQGLLHDHDSASLAENGDEFWQRYTAGLAQVTAATPDQGQVLVVIDASALQTLIFDITGQVATPQRLAASTITIVDQVDGQRTLRTN